MPTLDEMREAMNQKEMGRAPFSAVEDLTGVLRGFCSVRGVNPEYNYSELVVVFFDDADYGTALGEEVFGYLCGLAFRRMGLNKVITHCLDTERAYRDFLVAHGFRSDGRQREVLYTQGCWYDLEALSLFRAWTSYAAGPSPGS